MFLEFEKLILRGTISGDFPNLNFFPKFEKLWEKFSFALVDDLKWNFVDCFYEF